MINNKKKRTQLPFASLNIELAFVRFHYSVYTESPMLASIE